MINRILQSFAEVKKAKIVLTLNFVNDTIEKLSEAMDEGSEEGKYPQKPYHKKKILKEAKKLQKKY